MKDVLKIVLASIGGAIIGYGFSSKSKEYPSAPAGKWLDDAGKTYLDAKGRLWTKTDSALSGYDTYLLTGDPFTSINCLKAAKAGLDTCAIKMDIARGTNSEL